MFRFGLLFLLVSFPQIKGQCTTCEDGSEPINNPGFVPSSNFSISCTEIIQETTSITGGVNDTECKLHQLTAYQQGCCNTPPFLYCSVCENGEPYNESATIPQGGGGANNNPTCAENVYREASYIGVYVLGDCADTFLRRSSFYCGCSDAEQVCTLCPDGSPPGQPERADAFVSTQNCESLEYTFSLFREDECSTVAQGFGADLPAFCLCPNLPTPSMEYQCELCGEGLKLIGDLDKVFTGADAKYERTCKQADDFTQYILNKRICNETMAEARAACCEAGAHVISFMTSLIFVGILTIKALFL